MKSPGVDYGMRNRSLARGREQGGDVLPSLIFQNTGPDGSPHSKFSSVPARGAISPSKYGNSFASPQGASRGYQIDNYSAPRSAAKLQASGTPSRCLPRKSIIQRENDFDGTDSTPVRGYSSLDNQSTLAKYPDEHSALLSSVNRSAAKVDPFRGMSARRYADEEDIHGMGGVEDLISRGGQRSNQPEQRTPSADSSSHLVVSNPLSAEESHWPHWVVVFGFNPNVDHGSTSSLQNILRIFQEFGEIDDYSVSPGNWIFIKYKSPSQAERAISKNGAFLSNHIMIGVQSMNPRRARDMNVSIHSDGRMVHKGSGLGSVSREGLLGTAVRQDLDPDYDSIMRPPKKTKDVCTRIFEYFMMY